MTEDNDCDYMDLIEAYVDRFGDGPDIFDMDDEQAIAALQQAIDSGVPIAAPDEG